ncbi:MAG TPA: CAP domain-containing protein, partial [bacterium]|nr:CAP domain-containing protein [bacterium]
FLIFSACDSSDSVYGDGDSFADIDDQNRVNDRDPQERPDDYSGPGGGGITYDDNYEQNDTAKPDEEEVDEVENDDDFTELYNVEPDVAKCFPGEVSGFEKNKVLTRVNYLRGLHNLPPVSYSFDDDVYTQECSLMIAANKKLDHFPDETWKCYSNEGEDGCGKSNIYIRFGMISDLENKSIVDAFMTDEGVPDLGHRRWLIDPWLAHISFGRVDDYSQQVVGSAIKVNNEEQQNITNKDIVFVAYPFEIYPEELYNDEVMMSFTLIVDKVDKWKNSNVKFSGTAVAVKNPSNKIMKIKNLAYDNQGFGVPNNLRWYVEGIEKDVRYDVVVTNVLVNDVSRDYAYWFELK